jgi:hypothetical protein
VRRVRPPVSLHLHVPKPNNSLSISRISIRQLPTVYAQSPEGRWKLWNIKTRTTNSPKNV